MRISKKCAAVSPSMTLSITTKAKSMKKKGIDVISFSAGEPDFNTPAHIIKAAKKAMDDGFTKYTAASGMMELKEAVCVEFSKKDLNYKPSQIVISNGAKHSLFNAMQAVIEKDDEVLIPMPYWVSYPELVKLADGVPVFVQTQENFLVSVKQLERHTNSKTKALILNNPSNPTGAIYNAEQLKKIADFCIENDIYVISDEIYDKLIYEDIKPPSIASFDNMIDRTIVINGASKAYAMTGWRIGWAAAPQNAASAMGAMQSHVTSNPNTIAQYAALCALTDEKTNKCIDDMALEFKKRRDYMTDRVSSINNIYCVKPGGAFYMMVNISCTFGKRYKGSKIGSSLNFSNIFLDEKYVATVPGAVFGADEYIRMSYATSQENIKAGLKRLEEFLIEIMEVN